MSRHLTKIVFVLAVSAVFASAPARADDVQPTFLNVTAGTSRITYNLVHKLHQLEGVSRAFDGKARVLPDGTVQVAMRASIDSFDSGNANRDAHTKEVLEAARFPFVELKAVSVGAVAVMKPGAPPGASVDQAFQGELVFHGVRRPTTLSAHINAIADGRYQVTAKFTISLEEFKIERPSLMFIKVDDALRIDVELVFQK